MPAPYHPCFSSRFSFAPCRCFLPMQLPLLRSFLSYHSWSGSLDTPLTPLTSAKYLGSYITPTSSSAQMSTFVVLRPHQPSNSRSIIFFDAHFSPSQRFKLRVYTQIVQAIHGSESQTYSPAHITKIDSGLKLFAKFCKFKSHQLTPLAQMNISSPFLILFYLPVLLPPCESPTPGLNTLGISSSRFSWISYCIMFNPSLSLPQNHFISI